MWVLLGFGESQLFPGPLELVNVKVPNCPVGGNPSISGEQQIEVAVFELPAEFCSLDGETRAVQEEVCDCFLGFPATAEVRISLNISPTGWLACLPRPVKCSNWECPERRREKGLEEV
jgi:hypothetical protein